MRNCIGCGSIYFLISCADVYRRQYVLTEAKYAGEIITKYPWIKGLGLGGWGWGCGQR